MQIFTIRCPGISISRNTVSVQLNPGCKSTSTLACRVLILSEKLNHGREARGHYCSFTDTGHSALLRHTYRYESEKLPKSANQVDPFYMVKTDISKIVVFDSFKAIISQTISCDCPLKFIFYTVFL
jgi:hypothetical protein